MTKFENGVFSRSFYIHGFDVDHNSTLKVSTLLSMMHETAWSHVTALKSGWKELHAIGLFWGLSKLHLKIHRLPMWNETIMIETWARDKASIMFLRDYRAYDEAGNLLAEVSSEWILIDFNTHKLARTDRLQVDLLSPDRKPFTERVPRVTRVDLAEDAPSHQVVLSDLDMNLHVNNASYVRWLTNVFSYEFYNKHLIDEVVVNYITELKPDGQYYLAVDEVEPLKYNATVYNAEKKEGCKMMILWKEKV